MSVALIRANNMVIIYSHPKHYHCPTCPRCILYLLLPTHAAPRHVHVCGRVSGAEGHAGEGGLAPVHLQQRSRRRCSWQHCLTRHSSAASSGHSAASLDPAPAPGRRALRPVAEAELSHEPQRGGAAQRSCHLVIWQHRNNCGILRAKTLQTPDIYRFHRTLARQCFVGETL